jgi:hypothetical protein
LVEGHTAAARNPPRKGATCEAKRTARLADRAAETAAAAAEVTSITNHELFLLGLALYWAEGTKSKPWRIHERIVFVNSDPSVIVVVFLRWLELLGVSRERWRFRVAIHETADVSAAVMHWA